MSQPFTRVTERMRPRSTQPSGMTISSDSVYTESIRVRYMVGERNSTTPP